MGVRKATEQDPGEVTRADASGCEQAGLVSTASRTKWLKGRSPGGGVLRGQDQLRMGLVHSGLWA